MPPWLTEWHSAATRRAPIAPLVCDVLAVSDVFSDIRRPDLFDAGVIPRPRQRKVRDLIAWLHEVYVRPALKVLIGTTEIQTHLVPL
jgi:hypothetical protein